MQKKMSRRSLLKKAIIVSAGTLAACAPALAPAVEKIASNGKTADSTVPIPNTALSTPSPAYLPFVQKVVPSATPTRTPLPPGTEPRVVHMHANTVTSWSNNAVNYWNYVNQNVVNEMVDQGVMHLTGQGTAADAWRSLMPDYKTGEVVAIKVSFNNTESVDGNTVIDSIIEPVNAVIRGLKAAYPSMANSSIVVFDSSRVIPTRFSSKCLYSGVLFKDKGDDPWGPGSSTVQFSPPSGSPFTEIISKELVKARYVINIPIMKRHGGAGLSLAFKNHYGSINDPGRLHTRTYPDGSNFTTGYNPQIDLYKNPIIVNRTVLTVADGIFAAFDNQAPPTLWKIFNNQVPKSLFFSTDPVAVDSVMAEYLNRERIAKGWGEALPEVFSYLSLAQAAGLGVYERGDPFKNTFTKIDYQKFEI